MLIVDTHVHAALNWFGPVALLLSEMDANGVAHAVLIQHRGTRNHDYLLRCQREHPGRFQICGLLEPGEADAARALERMKAQGMAGVRLFLKLPWSPDDAAWRLAGQLGLVVSVIGQPEDFASARFKRLLDNCPDTSFCIEHLGRHGQPGTQCAKPPHDGFAATLECAQWPNTTIKVPGLGEILERPEPLPDGYPYEGQSTPLFDMALAAFGARRMMFGSDFPPSAAREGYANALEGVRRCPAFQGGDTLSWILGRSAAKLWSFPVPAESGA